MRKANRNKPKSRKYYPSIDVVIPKDAVEEEAEKIEDKKCDKKISVVSQDDTELRTCHYCWEEFDVKFDQEEETWQMQNAVLEGEKLFHPLCQ